MYKCKYCNEEFDNVAKLGGHCSRCKLNPTYTSTHICKYCGKTIIGKHSYTQHENHCELNPNKKDYKYSVRVGHNNNPSNCKYCNKECKNDNSLRNHERLCKENPNRDTHNSYGKDNLRAYREKIKNGEITVWNKGLTKETDIRVNKQSKSQIEYYKLHQGTFKGRHHSQETKDKISKAQLLRDHDQSNKNSHGKRGWLDNMFFMSTWELAYYIFMRDSGHDIKRCNIKFKYEQDGKIHTYTPDFIVDDNIIIEIKGYETDLDRFKYTLVDNLCIIGEDKIEPYLRYVFNTYKTKEIESLYDIDLSK